MANLFYNIKERSLKVADYKGIGRRDFCEKIGMTYQNFTGKAKESPLNSNAIQNIFAIAPDISMEWLITGKGNMLKDTEECSTPSINFSHKGSPYYNVDFVGGFNLFFNDQSINPDYYINFEPYNEPGVIWCNLTGRSMEPELNNGDIIAMKEMKSPLLYLPIGEIYGIVTNEYRTVKRVGKSDKKGFIRLIPTNKSPEYSPQDIPISMVVKVFAILGSMHRLF